MTATPSNKSGLTDEINRVLSELAVEEPGTDKYAQITAQLERLHGMKTIESKPRVSPDVLATIGANLLGILMIVGHERTHIVTSKALGFVLKLR